MHTTAIGTKGENVAAQELVRLGYGVLEQNWKTKWAEIDIVACKDGIVFFVEVKFRATMSQGDGFDYITDKKLQHMIRAAELWVVKNDWSGEYQLLAAAVGGSDKSVELREIM